MWASKRPRGGDGTRSIATVAPCEPTFSGAGRIRSLCHCKEGWSPWGSAVSPPRAGAPPSAISTRSSPQSAAAPAKNRQQTPQSAPPHHAARASHHVLFHNDDHARSGDGSLHQSLGVWGRHLTRDQHLCDTFPGTIQPAISPLRRNRDAGRRALSLPRGSIWQQWRAFTGAPPPIRMSRLWTMETPSPASRACSRPRTHRYRNDHGGGPIPS